LKTEKSKKLRIIMDGWKLIVAKGYNSLDAFNGWNETEGRNIDGTHFQAIKVNL